MGTKKNPGAFDCYANAAPDEPIFVLLGRDPHASLVVRLWAELYDARKRREQGGSLTDDQARKIAEALRCGESMEKWATNVAGKS